MENSIQRIMITGDSRMHGIEHYLRAALDDLRAFSIQLECLVTPGGTVRGVVEATLSRCATNKYEQIYCLAGVCDLTLKRSVRNLVPRFDSLESMLTYMEESYRSAQHDLLRLTAKPIICELIGLDIGTYNTKGRPHEYYQDIINEGIPIINRKINAINVSIESLPRAPFSASYVHKERRGKMTHRYDLALTDGVHFTAYFKNRTAQGIARMIVQN